MKTILKAFNIVKWFGDRDNKMYALKEISLEAIITKYYL